MVGRYNIIQYPSTSYDTIEEVGRYVDRKILLCHYFLAVPSFKLLQIQDKEMTGLAGSIKSARFDITTHGVRGGARRQPRRGQPVEGVRGRSRRVRHNDDFGAREAQRRN